MNSLHTLSLTDLEVGALGGPLCWELFLYLMEKKNGEMRDKKMKERKVESEELSLLV